MRLPETVELVFSNSVRDMSKSIIVSILKFFFFLYQYYFIFLYSYDHGESSFNEAHHPITFKCLSLCFPGRVYCPLRESEKSWTHAFLDIKLILTHSVDKFTFVIIARTSYFFALNDIFHFPFPVLLLKFLPKIIFPAHDFSLVISQYVDIFLFSVLYR